MGICQSGVSISPGLPNEANNKLGFNLVNRSNAKSKDHHRNSTHSKLTALSNFGRYNAAESQRLPKLRYAEELLDALSHRKNCKLFENFILSETLSSADGAFSNFSFKMLHHDYFLFWLDVHDYERFSAGPMRDRKGERIYERYFIHGSCHLLPFGSTATVIVQDWIIRRDMPSDLFASTKQEAFETLQLVLFPKFYQDLMEKGGSNSSDKRLSRAAVSQVGASLTLIHKLEQILAHVHELKYFIGFATQNKASHYIHFLLDVMNWKNCCDFYTSYANPNGAKDGSERLLVSANNHNQAPPSSVSVKSSNLTFMTYYSSSRSGIGESTLLGVMSSKAQDPLLEYIVAEALVIHEKYLKFGAKLWIEPISINVSAVIRKLEILSKVQRDGPIDDSIFEDVVTIVHQMISTQFMDKYFVSKNRKAYLALRDRRLTKFKISSAIREGDETMNSSGPSISEILNSNKLLKLFREYLVDIDELNILLLWLEIGYFKSLSSEHPQYIYSQAVVIYSRYLSETSTKKPSMLTQSDQWNILSRLFSDENDVTTNIFNDLHIKITATMGIKHRIGFLRNIKHVNLKLDAKKTATRANRNTNSSDDGIENGLSNSENKEMKSNFIESNHNLTIDRLEFLMKEVMDENDLPPSIVKQKKVKMINKIASNVNNNGNGGSSSNEMKVTKLEIFPAENNNTGRNYLKKLLFKNADHIPSLDMCLRSNGYCRYFRTYMKRRSSAAAIKFWLAVELTKGVPTHLVKRRFKYILQSFLVFGSRNAIQLAENTYQSIISCLGSNSKEPPRNLFYEAQDEIYSCMESKFYQNFLNSKEALPFWREIEFDSMDDNQLKTALTPKSWISSYSSYIIGNTSKEKGSKSVKINYHARRRPSSFLTDVTLVTIESKATSNLESVLSHAMGRQCFMEFCKKTRCVENIYFWLDVEDFKKIPCTDYTKIRAEKIFKTYIRRGANLEVNLSATVVKQTQELLETNAVSVFDIAQKEILDLMRKDVFTRFSRSDYMKQLVKSLVVTSSSNTTSVRQQNKPGYRNYNYENSEPATKINAHRPQLIIP